MRPKAVLFDLDNTLTHRALSIKRYVNCFLRDFGHVVQGDKQTIIRLISEVDNGGYLKAGSAFSSIRQAVGHVLTHELVWSAAQTPEMLSRHWLIHFPRSAVMMSGSELLVAQLSSLNIKVAVVSNGAQSSRQSTVASLPLASQIDEIFSSEKVGAAKPAWRFSWQRQSICKSGPKNAGLWEIIRLTTTWVLIQRECRRCGYGDFMIGRWRWTLRRSRFLHSMSCLGCYIKSWIRACGIRGQKMRRFPGVYCMG